jgi:hypothetical protein
MTGIRRILACPALIALVACAIRVSEVFHYHLYDWLLAQNHRLFGYEMGTLAKSIVLGEGFTSPYGAPGPTAIVPPVYPYLLAGVFHLFGPYTRPSALAVLILNCVISALTCIPMVLIARKAFGASVGTWAGWVWAVFPYSLLYVMTVWDTTLSALLASLLFLATLELATQDHTWKWIAFGLLWSLAALTNTALVSLFPFALGWICYRRRRCGMDCTRLVGIATVSLLLGVMPWLIRNYMAFGQFVFIRDGLALEFHMGNHEGANGQDAFQFSVGSKDEMKQYISLGELNYMAKKRHEVSTFIIHHPKLFVWLTLKRFEQFWFGTWPSLPLREPAQLGVRVIVTALALIGLILAIRDSASSAFLFLAFLGVFPLVYYLTHIDPRYRHPIEPVIVVLAVYAATTIAHYVWCRLSGPGSGDSRLSEARISPDRFRPSFP